MSDDLLNILSHSNKDIDNQKLMDYLSGKLSAQDKHDVEEWMVDNPFFNEAVEGLQHMKKEQDVPVYVEQLNKQLHQDLKQKKQTRRKKALSFSFWTYLAIIIILLLVVLVYLVIRVMISKH